MKRACRQAQTWLLESGDPHGAEAEVREHLQACPECRRLLTTWQALRDVPLPPVATTPPAHIELAIRREAAAVVEGHTQRHHAMTRWVAWFAIAACVALTVGVMLSLLRDDASPGEVGWTPVTATSADAGTAPLAWSQLDLDDALLELDADLEMTFAMLTTAPAANP